MSKYEVKSVVCDYGVFEDNELKLICNSHANALKIKEILETDSDMSKPYVWQDSKIEELEKALKFVFERMENVIKGSGFIQMPQVVIDKDKLRKWVVLCMKLENIEHSELVDMATKKRIADLEAKLAEHEKRANKNFDAYMRCSKKYTELKQQLAESEKRIELADCIIKQYADKDKNLYLQLAEKEKEILDTEEKWIKWGKQDKISFAVEQLTEIRDYVKECNSLDMVEGKVRLDIVKHIRLKIEQLEKELNK